MKMIPLHSSMFIALGYSPKTRRLVIQYDPEVYYQYENVGPEKVVEIVFAESHGRAFHELVKQYPKEHPYRRLSEKEVQNLAQHT